MKISIADTVEINSHLRVRGYTEENDDPLRVSDYRVRVIVDVLNVSISTDDHDSPNPWLDRFVGHMIDAQAEAARMRVRLTDAYDRATGKPPTKP